MFSQNLTSRTKALSYFSRRGKKVKTFARFKPSISVDEGLARGIFAYRFSI
jgi:hypothetical protein